MEITLPLEQKTVEEKLRMMETIWSDLTRQEEGFPSPTWHEDVLKAREAAIRTGREGFMDWDKAKKQLRDGQV